MYGLWEISCIGGGSGLPYPDPDACCCNGGTIRTGGVDCTDTPPGAYPLSLIGPIDPAPANGWLAV